MLQFGRRVALSLAACAAASLALVAGPGIAHAQGAKQQTFEFAVWFSDRDFYADYVRKWASDIEQQTEGRVRVRLHFSGSLVPAKETVNAVRSGAAGGGTTSMSFLAGLFRPMSYLEPLLWIPADPKVGVETMEKIQPHASALMEPRGLKLLFIFPSAGLVTNCVNGHVRNASEFKGKNIRAAGRWQGIQLRAVGAAPVAIDPGEVYIALQNKTVDCMMFLANLTLSAKIHEVAPYITFWRDGANASAYFVNMDQWKRVSEADQQTIMKISRQVVATTAPQLVVMQTRAIEELKKAGANVYMASDKEISDLKKAMSAVWDDVRKIAGKAGEPIANIVIPLQQ